MQDEEFLEYLGCDAFKWAQEFNKTAVKLGYPEMDEDWLIGWFANAIEYSATNHPDVKRLKKQMYELMYL